jgi:hypothetical protein
MTGDKSSGLLKRQEGSESLLDVYDAKRFM